MLRRVFTPWSMILTLLFLSAGLRAGASNTPGTPGTPPHDGLAARYEVERHQQLLAIKEHPDSVLTDFTTDGCSGGLSAGWEYLTREMESLRSVHGSVPPWESCCVEHDRVYHAAGARYTTAIESLNERKDADLRLRTCVLETGLKRTEKLSTAYQLSEQEIRLLYTAIADLMYHAVRLGGIPCSGLPWRWGYGWPECR